MKNNWKEKKLGEVCEVIAGQSPEGKYYNFTGEGLPFYQGKKEFTDKYLGEPTTWTKKITKEAQKDDILMSVRAPVGPINFATQKICMGRGLAAIRVSKTIDKEFLFNFLLKHEKELAGNTGAVFNSINKNQIENILIPIPPLPEQKRIVAILDKAFESITKAKENAEKNLENAREIFESYLQSVFEKKGEDWEEKKLGDVCEGVEYGTSAKSQKIGKVPVLRMGNIQDGELDWNDLVYTDNEEEIQKHLLQKNDVLFNRTNSAEHVGKTAIYHGERPAIFAGYLIRININKNLIDADFLNICLNSKKLRNYGFSVMTSSVNQANINGSKLKEYPLIVPPLTEQKLLVKKLGLLSENTKSLQSIYNKKHTNLEELKQSILQKAFNGELTGASV